MTVSTIKMNAEQYLQMGEDPPGVRLELVDGEIAVSPSPNPRHSRAVLQLSRLLADHIEVHALGEILLDLDTTFGEYDVRRPDILFFSSARVGLIGEKRLSGKPDLAVEVVSPTSEKIDKVGKFRQYAKGGVKYYWIVHPEEKTFEAYTLKAGRYALAISAKGDETIQAPPFKDLVIPLQKLWWQR